MNTMDNCSANVTEAIGFGRGPLGWKNVNPLPALVSIEVFRIIIAKFVTSHDPNFEITKIHTLGIVDVLYLYSLFVPSLISKVTQKYISGSSCLFIPRK